MKKKNRVKNEDGNSELFYVKSLNMNFISEENPQSARFPDH